MPSHKQANKYAVYLSQEGAEINHGLDAVTYLVPLSVEWQAGGRGVATFMLDISQTGTNVENITTPTKWNRQVEVWAIIDEVPQPIFWGELNHQEIRIDETQQVVYQATVEPWHFGIVPSSVKMHNSRYSGSEDTFSNSYDGEIVFNPVIDGQVEFNRSSKMVPTKRLFNEYHAHVDPESVRTSLAQIANEQTAEEWDIPSAVNMLCWRCNPDQEFIDNFDPHDARYDGMFDEAPAIVGLRMRMGQYLPAYLDALLKPLGYDWAIELTQEKRRIVVFKQFSGEEKTLKLAAIGEDFDHETTRVNRMVLRHSLSDVVNVVSCYGSLKEYEVTVELYRAWFESDDALTAADLDRTDPDSDYESRINVWRKWVANEAGDYSLLRTTVAPIPAHPSGVNIWINSIPRRRRFKDCLTLDASGNVRYPHIEYYDPSDEAWVPVPREWQVTILDREMGIYFAGDTPPESLIQYGSGARIRVTGTIVGDERVRATSDTLGVRIAENNVSPSLRRQILWLDVSDRFHQRIVLSSGPYASVFAGSGNDTLEVDDEDALYEYSENILEYNQYIGLRADISLIDLNTDYKIGQLLTKVEGREISLNLASETVEPKKYPQIVGIVWEPQSVRTRLVVAT